MSTIIPKRYHGCGVIASGMFGRNLQLSNTRVVKVARTFSVGENDTLIDSLNAMHREILRDERAVYNRLGEHDGIINCFSANEDGIELGFANQGDLRSYIQCNAEPHESYKVAWSLSLATTLSYIHSRTVFVDEIALRNILVHNGKLKFADFGQSILLPGDTDMDSVEEQDLTA